MEVLARAGGMTARHVCVIGAGVVGAATCYRLARAGHRVTLLDAADAPGTGTTWANGAQLSYSYVEPLATPGILRKLPAMLRDPQSPVRLRLTGHWSQVSWGLRFVAACRAATVQRSTASLLKLADLSRRDLSAAMDEDKLDFHHERSGKLVIYDSAEALEGAARQLELQRAMGCEQQLLDPRGCLQREPALASQRDRIAGGIWTASEAVGDAAALTRELIARAKARGAALRLGCRAVGWDGVRGRGSRHVQALRLLSGERIAADAFVLANGHDAADLARPLGLRLPIYPIKGYSITLPIRDALLAPKVSVTDSRRKMVFAPLAGRLRVAGFAELVGRDLQVDPARIQALVDAVHEVFPGGCELQADPKPWAGLRPATPTSRPIVGVTRWSNLFLNVGHGALGLTLAMGSARVVEEALAGRASEVGAAFAPAV
jgi:D-amino-acid dehydrogenase